MQARVGGRSDPFAGPIDMQFTPEERYQDGPLDGDIGNLAEGVLHDDLQNPRYDRCICIHLNASALIVKLDAVAFICQMDGDERCSLRSRDPRLDAPGESRKGRAWRGGSRAESRRISAARLVRRAARIVAGEGRRAEAVRLGRAAPARTIQSVARARSSGRGGL